MNKKPSPMLESAMKEAYTLGDKEITSLIKLLQMAEQDIIEGNVYNSEEFLQKIGIK